MIFFYWNLDCDYPVPTQHYILGVLGEIFYLLVYSEQGMRHLSGLKKEAMHHPEMVDFELWFKI